jgi:para-nitrobenzyl esterase
LSDKGGAVSEVLVEVTGGTLRGVASEGIVTLKGVPYAAPPVGTLRWMPPRPVEPWDGVRDAMDYGPSCPQPPERPEGWDAETKEDEDCLFLNVWTPSIDDRRRPVMVWFHGGGYTTGSGSWPLYDGTALARRGDVVVVTVNHRLGVLGYLHLAEIGGSELETSGNAGMLDLVASLGWVRDNIASLGGDPANVTIFGESGGGAKVSTLHVMPSARGLFHRAAVQSGPGLYVQTREQAVDTAARLASELGIEPGPAALGELRALGVQRLLEAQRELAPRPTGDAARPAGAMGVFAPVLDGVAVVSHPAEAFAAGTAVDVPVLIGRNNDEGTLLMAGDPVLTHPDLLDEAGLERAMAPFGERATGLLAGYRAAYPDATPLDLLIAIRSDAFMGLGTVRLAEKKLKGSKSPVYMYRFNWAAGPLRSGHGFEIAFVFDNVHEPVMHPSASRAELAERMSEAWIAFARDGDPGHSGLPAWPPYSMEGRATMLFDRDVCGVGPDPFEAVHAAWRS